MDSPNPNQQKENETKESNFDELEKSFNDLHISIASNGVNKTVETKDEDGVN